MLCHTFYSHVTRGTVSTWPKGSLLHCAQGAMTQCLDGAAPTPGVAFSEVWRMQVQQEDVGRTACWAWGRRLLPVSSHGHPSGSSESRSPLLTRMWSVCTGAVPVISLERPVFKSWGLCDLRAEAQAFSGEDTDLPQALRSWRQWWLEGSGL